MARTFFGYEENRGARHVFILLLISLALCIAGIVVNELANNDASASKIESPISETLESKSSEGVTWIATSDDADANSASAGKT